MSVSWRKGPTRYAGDVVPYGELLRRRMDRSAWSAEDIAAILACSQTTARRLMDSKTRLTAPLAKVLSAVVGIGAYEIMTTHNKWLLAQLKHNPTKASVSDE